MLSACNPSEKPPIPQRLDLIGGDSSKDWFIRNAAVTTSIAGVPKQTSLLLDCESDDKWTFFRNGKVEVTDGVITCAAKPTIRLKSFWLPDDTFSNVTFTSWRLFTAENKTSINFKVSNLTDSTMTLTGGNIFANSEKLVINYRTF